MKRAKWCLGLLLVGVLILAGGACGPTELPVSPTPYSSISIPIAEFLLSSDIHPHVDAVMSTVLGGELTVTLGSNPTTGYQWSEFAEISDETIVQQTSHKLVLKDYVESPPPGDSCEEVWVFKALNRGTTTILLKYSRPEVEEDAPHWTVTITATIK